MNCALILLLLLGFIYQGAVCDIKQRIEIMLDWINVKDKNAIIIAAFSAVVATALIVPLLIWR